MTALGYTVNFAHVGVVVCRADAVKVARSYFGNKRVPAVMLVPLEEDGTQLDGATRSGVPVEDDGAPLDGVTLSGVPVEPPQDRLVVASCDLGTRPLDGDD